MIFDDVNAQASVALQPGKPVVVDFDSSTTGEFHVELPQDSHWRFVVDQHRANVSLEVVAPDGKVFGPVNTPIDRDGLETIPIFNSLAGNYRVFVRAVERYSPPGNYSIYVEDISDKIANKEYVRAEKLMYSAARTYHIGSPEDIKHAASLWEQAAALWLALGVRDKESFAWYNVGTLESQGYLNVSIEQSLQHLQRSLGLFQEIKDKGMQASTENEIGLTILEAKNAVNSLDYFHRSKKLFDELNDRYSSSVIQGNICLATASSGDLEAALVCNKGILKSINSDVELSHYANILNNIGGIYQRLGNPTEARQAYQESLQINRKVGNRRAEASSLGNLALLYRKIGNPQAALEKYQDALRLFLSLDDERGRGRTMSNLGFAYFSLGEPHRALQWLQQSLRLRESNNDIRGVASTTSHLGNVYAHWKDWDKAIEYHEKSLSIFQSLGRRRNEASAHVRLGQDYAMKGDSKLASQSFERALKLLELTKDPSLQAAALEGRGRLSIFANKYSDAENDLNQALALRKKAQDLPGQVTTLRALAILENRRGHEDKALQYVKSAFDDIEDMRRTILSPDLRDAYSSSSIQAGIYELYIELLMRRHLSEPDFGYDERALEIAEQSRMRGLIASLADASINLTQGAPPELLEKRNHVTQSLSLIESQANDKDFDAKVTSLLSSLDVIDAKLREGSPQFASLTRPIPLNIDEIRHQLDEDTVLIQYSLGDAESFVWVVTTSEVVVKRLGPREKIEQQALKVIADLKTLDPRAYYKEKKTAAHLYELVFKPIQDLLHVDRIVVVPDGALHLIPFAALPTSPDEDAERLIQSFEIISVPSMTVLASQRSSRKDRHPTNDGIAVISDPIFEPTDKRLVSVMGGQILNQRNRVNVINGRSFARLKGTALEAQAAIAQWNQNDVLHVEGFRATKETVLSMPLGEYSNIHFATHALLDAEYPSLPALLLTQFDPSGNSLPGLLRLQDVYNLKLNAELVVLSACDTALGHSVKGEGLIGMSRGFMYAGATRVVASLWTVPDIATAELMTKFYFDMRQNDLSSASALRSAALLLLEDRRRVDPYYWAAFTLQGDWK